MTLSGLDADAAGVLLSRGTVRVGAAVRERLVARTRGNALALVELPSVLTEAQLAGEEPLPEALPMTEQLETVFHERVGQAAGGGGRFLLVAAADDTQDIGVVTRAAQTLGVGQRGLEAAEEAGLVLVHGTRLEFRHPLSARRSTAPRHRASAAMRTAPSPPRLPAISENGDRRAWHLASAAVGHDVDVVQALDDAAGACRGTSGAHCRCASTRACRRADGR